MARHKSLFEAMGAKKTRSERNRQFTLLLRDMREKERRAKKRDRVLLGATGATGGAVSGWAIGGIGVALKGTAVGVPMVGVALGLGWLGWKAYTKLHDILG